MILHFPSRTSQTVLVVVVVVVPKAFIALSLRPATHRAHLRNISGRIVCAHASALMCASCAARGYGVCVWCTHVVVSGGYNSSGRAEAKISLFAARGIFSGRRTRHDASGTTHVNKNNHHRCSRWNIYFCVCASLCIIYGLCVTL